MSQVTLNISTSPHLVKGSSTVAIMQQVVVALLPATGYAVYSFGLSALLVILTAVASAVLTEHMLCRLSRRASTISDWSAVITGLLLGLTLPPIFPLWMTAIGGMVAIGLGKFVFGGLGYNVFNPALVGRAVLQAAFPVAITTWFAPMATGRFANIHGAVLTLPFMQPAADGMSGATPLSAFKFDHVATSGYDLMMGNVSGSAGETSAWLLLLGGLYLAIRKMMNWRIPVVILLTVFVFSGILYLVDQAAYPSPVFMLFSGGLMLGAVFMATDMVASPITTAGVIIYGAFIGVWIVVIRVWGGLPEGVMYAILLANAIAPQIDRFIQPRVYGTGKKIKK